MGAIVCIDKSQFPDHENEMITRISFGFVFALLKTIDVYTRDTTLSAEANLKYFKAKSIFNYFEGILSNIY